MIPDYQTLMIAVLFASQIAVLSFYTPKRWQNFHARLLEQYPREEYPLLHPLPKEELQRKFALFRPLHLTIGVGASLAFIVALIYADSARGLAGPMMMCLLVQLALPLYVAVPLEVRIQKALKSLPPPNPRSVELRKWRLTDFVSPLWIVLGIAVQALSLACAVGLYLYRPDTLGIFPTGMLSSVALLAMASALFGANTAGARADPFMSQPDTFHVRQRIYRGLFITSAAFGAWGAFSLLSNAGLLHFDFTYQTVCFSVILQIIGLALVFRWQRELDTRDFGVYRAAGGAHAAR